MKRFLSLYWPNYPRQVTYMLQMVGYDPKAFWRWWKIVKDFRLVNKRRDLELTRRSQGVLLMANGLSLLTLGVALILAIYSLSTSALWPPLLSLVIFIAYPFIVPLFLVFILVIIKKLVVEPRDNKVIKSSREIFSKHLGVKIAVAGSYGKTTMKETLLSVLSEGGKSAATPGNKNVAISHAVFARSLKGDEKFVIVEFGEGYKGDVAKFCKNVQPNVGIITGLAPNHLDEYGDINTLKKDLLSLAEYLNGKDVYISGDNHDLKTVKTGEIYDENEALGWKVRNVKNSLEGLSFEIKKGSEVIKIKSGLVGRHLISTLALAAALARKLGLNIDEIERGIQKTKPFEHRLEPRLLHGAWIIDDTYNGSIEGMRAGLRLLGELETCGSKIYVTPGLVDQGEEKLSVHTELGKLIARAKPDKVVLMKNSVTDMISDSLKTSNFTGILEVVDDPLNYYQNLELTVAKGDIIMLQNDWTDNYA